MAQEKQEKKVEKSDKPQLAKVATLELTHCKADGCKKKIEKFGFCMDHYTWYMEGLLRGDGKKPIDFEEKYQKFVARHAKKVA